MIQQSRETETQVLISNEFVPGVTSVEINLERQYDLEEGLKTETPFYTITIKRYLPVGVKVKSYYTASNFELIVSDLWTSYVFSRCHWLKFNKIADSDGVRETIVIVAKSVTTV